MATVTMYSDGLKRYLVHTRAYPDYVEPPQPALRLILETIEIGAPIIEVA
jgi:hypothetical protein